MPPSTRAGQTGREERDDDQAAATAGNGCKEGWLTQVVRILQLANLALTVEEAIVQVMSLISISSQAPKGEVEKIPKDISSAIAHIKKLSDNNWHTWEPTFINCLQWDVIRLGKELDSIWNDAVCLGKHFDKDLKKSTLYCCTAQDWFYANSVNALKMAKPDCVTHHMVNDERMLLTSTSKDGQISMAGDEKLQVKAIGDASLQVGEATIQLLDVLYVPKLNSNLLSIQGLIENRQALALELEKTLNDVPEDNENTGRHNNVPEDGKNTGDQDSYLWHERFGHLGRDKTRQIQAHYLGTGEKMEHESKHCNACSQGKQTQVQMSQSELKRAEVPLELVHVDLMTDLKGHANYHYALVAVDDFSSLIYTEPLCTKSAALTALRRWVTRMERAMGRKLKTLCSDNGGEWCSLEAEDWQTQEGFKWQKSILGISIQNGQVERAIRLVQEKMCSMLIGQACPRELWPYAITAVVHVMNLTLSATKTIPYKAFYRTTAHKLAQQLRVFGCLAWVHIQWKDQQGKYRPRAKPAIMIGYDDKHKVWKFCNLDQPTSIQWSNSATFHEDKGWMEEETRSEAVVEDLLPAMDSTVGTANTAVLNMDPTLGEAMNGEDAQLWREAI
ncbi:uncharacterized protein UHO2_01135 [Ustilago hordei]|uniref:uncharacterized protein n=1 Tax=Ustilago hordei TaxID=120017 RepID=UPI001A60A095|nr:uncharacterized protein UHO2_01135 [Ustilago hordei]SYW74270.1 related to retrotransposon protein [Ustilago hordei]